MSQEKVDRYKEKKARRREIYKKEKSFPFFYSPINGLLAHLS